MMLLITVRYFAPKELQMMFGGALAGRGSAQMESVERPPDKRMCRHEKIWREK